MTSKTAKDGPRPETVSRRTESLIASVAQHHKAISAHQSQLLNAIVELDRRKAWRVDGSSSMVAWLTLRCGVSASTAREWVTAAAKLQRLPEISDALSKGKLSFDQVKPLVEVAKPETDATLAEQATHWSAKQVRELAIAARKQSDQQATGFYARRFLRFDDRRRSLTGVLPVDQYAVVKSALVDRASRRCAGQHPVRSAHGRCPGGGLPGRCAGRGGREQPGRRHAAQPPDDGRARRPLLPGGRSGDG